MDTPLLCSCVPSIVWVRDADQTLLVNRDTGESWIVCGVEEIIWDWLCLGYSQAEITVMLSLVLASSVEEAGCTFDRVLCNWLAHGIVDVVGEMEHGKLDYQHGM